MKVSRASFEMEKLDDTSPDLSWIGKFTDKWEKNAIEHNGDRGTYKYFVPANTAEQTGSPDSVEQDHKRLASYGESWSMIGIRATVVLEIPMPGGDYQLQGIESSGLWGIESDSDEQYFKEVFAEQCAELVEMLTALGIEVVGQQ